MTELPTEHLFHCSSEDLSINQNELNYTEVQRYTAFTMILITGVHETVERP